MALHPEVPQDSVTQMFSDMDIDHSGEVDYSEFLSATLSAQRHSNASLMSAFNTLDSDKNGYITEQDIVQALDGQMKADDIRKMLIHADASGKVSFQTFKAIMLQGLKTTQSSPAAVVASVAAAEASFSKSMP